MAIWNTTINLVSIPEFQINNGAQMIFQTKEEQEAYFLSHVVSTLEFTNQSYMRLNGGTIRIKANADTVLSQAPNWVMFKNDDFGYNKWFYANILDVYYVNANVTEISYAVDSWQSFMFEVDLSGQSYIARRTFSGSADDENVIAQLPLEDLDIGENYIVCDSIFDFNDTQGNYETEQFYYLMLTEPLTSTGSTHHIITGTSDLTYIKDGQTISQQANNGINSILYGYVMNYRAFNYGVEAGLFSTDCSIVNALQLVMVLPFGRSLFPTSLNNLVQYISTAEKPNFGQEFPDGSELYDQAAFSDMSQQLILDSWCSGLNDYIKKVINKTNLDGDFNNSFPESAIGKYLYRFPYTLLEVNDFYNQPTNYNINSIDRKNQYSIVRNNQLPINKYATIGQNPMLVYGINGYQNTGYYTPYNQLLGSNNIYSQTAMDMNTVQSTIQLPIISDYLATFMQANQNQINAQRANLKDTLQTQLNNAGATTQAQALSIVLNQRNAAISASATAANARSQNQATLAATLASTNTEKNNTLRTNYTALTNATTQYNSTMAQAYISKFEGYGQAAIGGAQAIGGALLGGGASSIVNGIANAGSSILNAYATYGNASIAASASQTMTNNSLMTANQVASQSAATAISNANALSRVQMQSIGTSYNAAMAIANNNAQSATAQMNAEYGNTLRTANTAYNTAIRSLNARIEDARNIPATVQSMGNNASLFNIMFNREVIRYTTKAVVPQVMQRLIDYWTRNGFICNNNDSIQNIMNKFQNNPGFFIQTVNATVRGKVPTDHIYNIKAMFDTGISIWKPSNYMDFDSLRTI